MDNFLRRLRRWVCRPFQLCRNVVCGCTRRDGGPTEPIRTKRGAPIDIPMEQVNVVVAYEDPRPSVNRVVIQKIFKRGSTQCLNAPLPTYQLEMKTVYSDKNLHLRKCEFGSLAVGKPEKVLMLVGATGSGKTTLLNGIINYIVGVKREDDFRFKLRVDDGEAQQESQAVSQTQWVTAYKFHHHKEFAIPFTLTIVDTPGFGDTRGLEQEKKTVEKIKQFFHAKGKNGIDHLSAIGFVVPAANVRLTPTQRFIFDSVLAIFGRDIRENIFLLITFSDGLEPPVLSAVKKAKVPYNGFFKFNNSALFANNKASRLPSAVETLRFDSMFWNMGLESFCKFFRQVDRTQDKSLFLTQEVLRVRANLETFIEGIHEQVTTGLSKLHELKREADIVRQRQGEIDSNEDFAYTVVEYVPIREVCPVGEYTTTCLTCNFTCHYRCYIENDDRKMQCVAMRNEYCVNCPRKCIWSVHKNTPYRLRLEKQEKTKTSRNLMSRYGKPEGGKITAESLVKEVEEDYHAVQVHVLFLAEQVRKSLNELREIALNPTPFSAIDYIQLLIESERKEQRDGWNERVKQLEEALSRAQMLYDIADNNFDPFVQYRKKYDEFVKVGDSKEAQLRQLATTIVVDRKNSTKFNL